MNRCRSYDSKDSERDAASRAALADWVWIVRYGGIARAVMLPGGTIEGVKLGGDGELVEITIPRPSSIAMKCALSHNFPPIRSGERGLPLLVRATLPCGRSCWGAVGDITGVAAPLSGR
jgi:hypothetical protein